jgi:AraC-like DNA-binding protein
MAEPRTVTRPQRRQRGTPEETAWQVSALDDTPFLRARWVRQTFPRHFHETFVICVNECGAHRSWFRGANVIIPERAVTVVPPGEVHTGEPVPGAPWHYRAMYPGVNTLAELASELGLPRAPVASFRSLWLDDPTMADAFLSAHRAEEERADPLTADGRVVLALGDLLARHALGRCVAGAAEPRRADRDVQRMVEYLNDNFALRITLEQLVRSVSATRYAALRAFRRATGIPPHAYLTQVRIERAKTLLRSALPLAVVAQRTGFADQSHLTRHFRRLVGVTPGVFARGLT